MTIGTGIFLSSLLLTVVILFGLTKDRWAWRRIVKRAAFACAGVILVGLLGGGGLYVWNEFPTDVEPQTEYARIRIGMTPAEVKYVKGYPPTVYGSVQAEGEMKGLRLVIETDDIEIGKEIEDFDEWSYQDEGYRVDVQFDSEREAVIAVQCYSEDRLRRCPAIGGISDGESEEDVIRKFGQPNSAAISGVTKSLYYSDIGVFFTLSQERVYMLGVNDKRYRKP